MVYNEATWLRAIILMIPYIGSSVDMLLYKKGNDTEKFIAGEDLEDGDNCYLNVDDGKFYKACAVSSKTGSTLIVKALQPINKDCKGVFLVKGKYFSKNLKTGTLFLGLEPGKLSSAAPKDSDNVVRLISMVLNENEEYFNPSSDWLTLK